MYGLYIIAQLAYSAQATFHATTNLCVHSWPITAHLRRTVLKMFNNAQPAFWCSTSLTSHDLPTMHDLPTIACMLSTAAPMPTVAQPAHRRLQLLVYHVPIGWDVNSHICSSLHGGSRRQKLVHFLALVHCNIQQPSVRRRSCQLHPVLRLLLQAY